LLLHGIGSNEEDLMGLAPYLDPRFFIVSARAPIPLRAAAYAWFDLYFTQEGPTGNMEEAEHSRSLLIQFIQELIAAYDLDARRVYLMGFSQGAIMSLIVGLTQPDVVAGIVAMSGRLPQEIRPQIASPDQLSGLPILVVHGVQDQVLPIEYGRSMRDQLQQLPLALTYREYEMGHQVSGASLTDSVLWLQQRLQASR
jgi:phospholipase/carboxylesterase